MVQQTIIPEGSYLAVVTDVVEKINEEKGSLGLVWDLLINTGNIEEWDNTAETISYQHYTYIGRLVNGMLRDTSNAFKTAEIMNALGFTRGVISKDDAKYRQIIVEVKHQANPEDCDRKGNPLPDANVWPFVRKVKKYIVDGEVAPVLHLADK